MQTTIKGMTGSELMMMEFEPQNFIVQGLIPEGLNILAGNKGHGKSFLVLDLAIAVNEGGLLWNAYQSTQGAVLFLALEDTMPRMQRRMAMRGAISPGNIEFYTDWKPLQEGGLEDIRDWITVNPTVKMIVLDTLVRVAPIAGNYDKTTHTYGALSKFARDHRIAILACHHMVKQGSKDPFLGIHGSTGIGGAADTLLVLKRRRFNSDATLGITGKDVEETELAMQFDRHRGAWSVVGAASDLCVSDERQVLHDIIADHGQPMSLEDIQAALEKKGIVKEPGTIRVLLSRMVADGEVSREGRGRYVVERGKLPMLPLLPIRDEVSETTSNNGNKCNEAPALTVGHPAVAILETNTTLSPITSTTPVAHGDSTLVMHAEATTNSQQKAVESNAIPAADAQLSSATSPTEAQEQGAASITPSKDDVPEASNIAAAFNAGRKIQWPKGANAVRVIQPDGTKTITLKVDADTLKGTGLDSEAVIEFGWVPNDSKGRPDRSRFKVLKSVVPEVSCPAQAVLPSLPAVKEAVVADGNNRDVQDPSKNSIPTAALIEASVPSPSVDTASPVAPREPTVDRTGKVMFLVPRVDFAYGGKLSQSYSADRIAQGKIREPYKFEQANYVAVSICQDDIVAYELVAADQYSGQTRTYAERRQDDGQDLYEGIRVMWRGKPYVLSNRTEFRPQDLPVEQPAATGAEPEKLHEAKTPARDACIATDAPPRPAPSVARQAVQFAENPSAKLPDVEVIAVTGAPAVEVAATVGGNSFAAVPTAPEFRNAETAKPQSENQIDQRIKSYLAHTPASDGIWKQYLKQASVETVEAALAELPSGAPKNARSALESRLRKLRKSTIGNAASHNGGRGATDRQPAQNG